MHTAKQIGWKLITLLSLASIVFGVEPLLQESPPDADMNAKLELSRQLSEDRPEESIKIAHEVLKFAEEKKDRLLEARARHCLGMGLRKNSLTKSAQEQIREAAELFKNQGNKKEEADTYNTLGIIFSEEGQYALALEFHLKALAIRREIQDQQGLAYSYNNLGNSYRNTGDFEKSLKYYLDAIELKKKMPDKGSLAYSYSNIGHTYLRMGQTREARKYFEMALEIRRALGLKSGIASSLNSIGVLLEADGQFEEAADYYRSSFDITQELGHKRPATGSLNNLGSVYRKMGQFKQALNYLFEALELGSSINAPVVTNETLFFISQVYEDMGNFKMALDYHKKYTEKHELLFNESNSKQLMEIQVEFETREKEIEIKHLQTLAVAEQERSEQQSRFFLILACLFVGFIFLLAQRYRYMNRSRDLFQRLSVDLEEKGHQLADANAELERLVKTDALTGLLNRRGFDSQLKKDWAVAARKKEPLSLLMIDVDLFKAYNDTFGHQAGDECLAKLGRIFLEIAQRPEDNASRYGGEEFALILGNTSKEGSLAVAEKLRKKVEEARIPCAPVSKHSWVTVSIGSCSLIPSIGLSVEEIIKNADQALYRAKEKGRNRVEV